MSAIKWEHNTRILERLLGFILDCPRCRAWNLIHYYAKKQVNIKCSQCGLELSIPIRSLVHYSEIHLPVVL
ncbi:MAG: hypothetical protein ACW97P_03610 [Candidatus Hodarchaeales archaeon]|jgi:transcription elongation factor Elf1